MVENFTNPNKTKTEQVLQDLMIKQLQRIITKDMDVLDVGPHNAYLSEVLDFNSYTGVDLQYIPQSKDGKYTAIFHTKDIREFLATTKDQFDFIIISLFIEHIHNVYQFINSLANVLKPNGLIYIRYPNARSLNRILGVELGMLNNPYKLSKADVAVGHLRMFDHTFINKIEQFCRDNYTVVDKGGYMFKPLPNKLMDLYFEDCLDRFVKLNKFVEPKGSAEIWCILKKLK